MQAVSGSAVPPKTIAVLRLAEHVRSGRFRSSFTGGGCLVKPVTGSRGRLVLVRRRHAVG